MQPKTISEQLMFNTVHLVASDGSSGTGFFFNFDIDGKICPTLITNKHVVRYNPDEVMTFFLHLKTGNNLSEENYQVTCQTEWIFHSKHDLCFCFINPVLEEVKKITGKNVFYKANSKSIVATQEKLKELSALEELVMVGYPIGLWDKKNNFPIFRKGYTASHPVLDFNQQGIGLVDMACFPGSSGSPIYILNESSYSDKTGTIHIGQRIILIGILYAGPQYNAQGDLVVTTIPTQQKVFASTPIMTNLGYYVKASELNEFESYIRASVQRQKES